MTRLCANHIALPDDSETNTQRIFMSKKVTVLFVSCLTWGLCTSAPLEANADDRPNLVFVIADDCTFRDLRIYGGEAYTPNIDRFAASGMKLNQCFQTAPMCSPTRHSIYTGLYPVKSGAYTNHSFAHDHVKSVVHYLKPMGYRVALSGKGHIGPREVFDFEYSKASKEQRKTKSVIDMQAVDLLMMQCKRDGQPFCLFACSNEPHGPWNKGKEYRKLYDAETLSLRPYMVDTPEIRAAYVNYLSEISFFDWEVGQLLEMLDKHGLADNTVVVVVSEQGNDLPFAKWTCYDSGLQSAMLVRWPNKIDAGSQCDALVEYIDVLPTFVELAGGTPDPVLDGNSLVPLLMGEASGHKDFVFGLQTSRGIYHGPHHYPIRSIRDKHFKLILNLAPGCPIQELRHEQTHVQKLAGQSGSGRRACGTDGQTPFDPSRGRVLRRDRRPVRNEQPGK